MSATADDVLSGLDVAEDAPRAEAPEPAVDPAPEPDKTLARADDGKFKGDDKPNSADTKPNSAKEAPKEEPKTIPLASHLEERNRHRVEQEQTRAQLKALQDQLTALQNPPKTPPATPDFTADPKGYVDHRVTEALQKLETGTTEVKKTAEQAQQEAAFTRFHQTLASTEQQFVAQTPDYIEALVHLRTLRATELVTLNPELTQPQLVEMIQREELGLAAQLLRAGRNPHEVAYSLAKARGYTPKAPNGAAGAPVLPEVKGQKQLPPDQTLGTGGGSPDSSAETFLNDDEVFDKAFNEMFGKRKRA